MGGCTSTLLAAFSHYAAFLPHACHDMRYEDLRSAQGGSAREAQRLISVLGMHVDLEPYTLHPAPCTLHPAPCTLHPAPCTLHPTP